MLLIVLALLALSLGEASADGTEPDGEVVLDDLGLDADDLDELAAGADLRELDLDGLSDLDDLDAADLDAADLASDDLDAGDLDAADLASDDLDAGADARGDLAAEHRATWPATGTTDARAAALARRHSLLGRFDLSLTWRRTEPIASARRDEVWLYGTWRL